jgi:hypothetical protein
VSFTVLAAVAVASTVWASDYAWPAPPILPPIKTCAVGLEPGAFGKCVRDCRAECRRVRFAEEQTPFYGPDGRSLGTATLQGDGTVSVGSATTDPSGTTRYYSPDGRSLGTSTGPARPPFPGR